METILSKLDAVEIGIVKMSYSSSGKITKGKFVPTMQVSISDKLKEELKEINATTDEKILKDNADYVLASWFSKLNEIELEDREQYKVVSEAIKCTRYPSGQIKDCEIKYSFQKIKNEKVNN